MIAIYTGNLFNNDNIVDSIHSNNFPLLLAEILNRLQNNDQLTHGLICDTRTGRIKTTCRKQN